MDMSQDAVRKAVAAFRDGRNDEAEALCHSLVSGDIPDGEACFLLGLITNKAGRHEESLRWLRKAEPLVPPSVRLFSALGGAFRAVGDLDQAGACFTRCIQLDPGCAEAFYQLGNLCHKLRDLEKAAWLYRKATNLAPENHGFWNNLANTLRDLGRIDESLSAYDRALALRPDCSVTRANRGITLLTAGRLEEGFQEYHHRWHTLKLRPYPQPLWRGEPIPGKTLFVFAEQGLGDTLQFVRYLRLARERVGRIILECQPPLKTLLEQSRCADLVVSTGDCVPEFDCHLPLLDLPGVFRTTLDTIPAAIPYLTVEKREGLPTPASGKPKIGLAWAGNPEFQDDAVRSIPLENLDAIFRTPGASYFSLQLKIPARDEACFRASGILNPMEQVRDFADTAALVSGLDLVISVDTAVAHLAGALGRPVWMFIHRSPDWRWLLGRSDTPWYPTMRLFRQPSDGKWPAAIAQAAVALRDHLNRNIS